MDEPFGQTYVNNYDALYKDKNFEAEADALELIFKRDGQFAIHSILEIDCATGNHLIPLTLRGYQTAGLERSRAMVEIAYDKFEKLGLKSDLYPGDARNFDLDRTFDVALMMLDTIGFQNTNDQLADSLQSIRRHLNPSGLFIFEFCYAPTAIRSGNHETPLHVITKGGEIRGKSSRRIELKKNRVFEQLDFDVKQGGQVVESVQEENVYRYFTPLEIEYLLKTNGFVVEHFGQFPKFDQDLSDDSWSGLTIARAN
jgi:SAM-dependent methyltransferase